MNDSLKNMLFDEHVRELVNGSSIDPEVIRERGYETASRPSNADSRIVERLKAARIPSWATREAFYFPGLIIPWYRATGERTQLQFKPKHAVPMGNGRRAKYASAKGCASALDVHPRWSKDKGTTDPEDIPAIRNVHRPLHITEGVKKADSLTSRGLVTVALNGVYNWRSALGSIGDWEDIPLRGRDCIVVFDSDAVTNRNVLSAMARIGKWLKSKGANARFVIPPAMFAGKQVKGIDDYFALGGKWEDVEIRKTPPAHQIIGVDRFTDAGLSEEVAAEALEGRFCYTTGLGWLQWNGIRWTSVDEGTASEAIRQYCRSEYLSAIDRRRDAVAADDQKAADAAEVDEAGWHKYQNTGKISALVKLAREIDGVKREAGDFDQDPDVLNTPDGLLHLETGFVEPHSSDHLVTRVTAVSLRNGRTTEAFDKALSAVPEDAREWLQVHMGQAITGYSTHRFIMCSGGGANGKTALMGTFFSALGGRIPGESGYAGLVDNRLLLESSRTGSATPEKMTLRGLRFAYVEETPEVDGRQGKLDTQTLKELVDVPAIRGRQLYKDGVQWVPSHSMVLNTNHPPIVTQTDHGTWRRLVNLRFDFRFRLPGDSYGEWRSNDRDGDAGIKERLNETDSLEAALAWIVEGTKKWYAAGRSFEKFPDPACVVAATQAWRHESDSILRFLEETCAFDADSWVATSEIYEVFRNFCSANGIGTASLQLFTKRIMAHTGLPGEVSLVTRRIGQPGESTRQRVDAIPFGGSVAVRVKGKQVRSMAGLRFLEDDE